VHNPFHTETRTIRVSQVQKGLGAKITALLDWMQDAAYTHSNSLIIFSTDRLLKRNMSWVLMRKLIRIFNLPFLGQKIHLTTYPSSINRYFAFRDFELRDQNDNALVLATTSWAVFDLEKRRIIKTPPDFIRGFSPPKPANLDFMRPRINSLVQPDLAQEIKIRKSDLDLNGHVNHACLADWSLACLPVDLGQNLLLKEMDIVFRSECTMEDNAVFSQGRLEQGSGEDRDLTCLHSLKSKALERELARAVSVWTLPPGDQVSGHEGQLR